MAIHPETEERLILSVLRAHVFDGTKKELPWGITWEGWVCYTNHKNKKVRDLALAHPHCPPQLKRKVISFKIARELLKRPR